MKYLFYAFVILISCTERKANSKKTSNSDTLETTEIAIKKEINTPNDGIHFDSVILNGKLPLKGNLSFLLKNMGKPDSIIKEYGWECGNYLDESDCINVYFYGKTRFLISQETFLLHKLDLSSKLTHFQIGDIIIDKEMKLTDLQKVFPKTQIKDVSDSLKSEASIEMIQNPRYEDASGFIFRFDEENLIEIELWWFIC